MTWRWCSVINSIQFYFYSVFYHKNVSRWLTGTETQSLNPQKSTVAKKKKKLPLTWRNVEQDPAYQEEPEPPPPGRGCRPSGNQVVSWQFKKAASCSWLLVCFVAVILAWGWFLFSLQWVCHGFWETFDILDLGHCLLGNPGLNAFRLWYLEHGFFVRLEHRLVFICTSIKGLCP